ncbi:MAG: amidohydrolase [Alcaligenaceae bacterium]|nr:amidohydrolase [Alcaligenaceae bacterium]
MKIEVSDTHAQDMTTWRRTLHRNPELGFEEYETAAFVAERLREWGIETHTGIGGTGVVGVVHGAQGPGRNLGLRADMDALPMQEQTGLPYQSVRPNRFHGCGHDGHTAILLGVARHFASDRDFRGTLNLIFQPAEEGLGGAKRMMEDGLFTKYPCDAIFAMHNMPGHPQGHLLLRDGPTMASSDNVTIVLEGVGGHGAVPHRAADPVVAGAAIVMGLQSIVARNIDPLHMAVITVGAFNAGRANNVIPQTATLKLSVRALDREVRDTLQARITELVHNQAASYQVRATIDYGRGYPVLVNTPAETDFARQVAVELVGAGKVDPQTRPLTGSEDFAFMLEDVPGSYLLVGNGDGSADGFNGGHGACMVHNPGYDFNDHNLPVGAAYWVLLTQRYLTR